jgi:hypothetical protein
MSECMRMCWSVTHVTHVTVVWHESHMSHACKDVAAGLGPADCPQACRASNMLVIMSLVLRSMTVKS